MASKAANGKVKTLSWHVGTSWAVLLGIPVHLMSSNGYHAAFCRCPRCAVPPLKMSFAVILLVKCHLRYGCTLLCCFVGSIVVVVCLFVCFVVLLLCLGSSAYSKNGQIKELQY